VIAARSGVVQGSLGRPVGHDGPPGSTQRLLRELLDRNQITTLVDQLGRALDEARFDDFRTIYTPDAIAVTLGEVYRFDAVRTAEGWRLSRVETTPLWSTGTRPSFSELCSSVVAVARTRAR
jgi:hypothetical protein